VAGLGYRAGGRRALGKVRPWNVDERLHTASAFVQDDIEIAGRWQLTMGATIEHNTYTGLQAQPTLRVLWRPTKTQTVWGAASQGVGAGHRIERARPTRESESTFGAEFVRAHEAGYRVLAGRLSFDAVGFITEREARASTPVRFGSTPEVPARGVELAASWRPMEWWGLGGSYGLLHLGAPRAAPRHQAQFRSVFTLNEDMEINAELFRVSAVPSRLREGFGGQAARLDAYTKLNLRFEYEIGERLEASIGARNLFHHGGREFYDSARRHVIPVRTAAFAELEWGF
jgi:iron complex outermembrane receptor protein